MATTPKVLLKRSSIAGKVPNPSDLQYGELAINFTDGKIYYKDASNNINAFVDSARVQAIADAVTAQADALLDSAEITALVDSDYVSARVDRSLFLDSADAIQLIDSAYVTARVDASVLLDSAEIKQFIDSDWIQSKITVAYINSLIGVDAETLGGLPPNYYNNYDNIYNKPQILDSADVAQIASDTSMDSAEVIQLIDSAYVQARQLDSAATATTALNALKLNGQSPSYYLNYDNLTNQPTILDVVDVSNVITADVDKAFVDALNINANRLQGYSAQNFFDAIDSASNIANQAAADALDSAEAIALIDSAHVRARQDYSYTSLIDVPDLFDSNDAVILIDSAYVNARLDTSLFLDSAETIALIDSAHVRARQITYNTSNFTDSDWVNARIDSAINALIDGAPGALDTLNELAAALNDDSNAYNTLLSQIAALPDSAEVQLITEAQVDSAYVRLRQDYAYSSLTGVPTALSQFTNDTNYLDSATVQGVIDQSYISGLIDASYLDSADATALIDSDYIETRVKRLIGDITVRGNLVPESNGQYSLGTLNNRWSDLFVGGSSIYLGRIVLTESDGKLAVKDSNGQLIAQINLDGNTTDDLTEGSVNLYYTDTRVRAAISATTGSAGYDSVTGIFSIPATSDDIVEGDNLFYTTARFDSDLNNRVTDDLTEGSLNLYYTSARVDSDIDARIATKTTDDLAEGSNLYYTKSRVDSDFDTRIATKTTDDLAEGDNLYYTTERFDSDLGNRTTTDLAEGDNLYYTTARHDSDFDIRLTTKTTTNLAEGDNLYYTKSRVDSDIAASFIDSASTVNVTINNYVEDKVDSAYVLARVNEAPFLDSVDAIALIDSAYVQLRQDYAYSSLTGVPTNVSTFINDANYLDSTTVQGVIDQSYVQSNQITYNTSNFTDSAFVTGLPVSTFTNDANYISTNDSALLGSLTTTGNIIVGGNLQVTGTTTTINTQDLNVTDNMIYMAGGYADSAGAPQASIDIGFAAGVNDNGTYEHVGLFRDATDDTFKVFQGYTPEPDNDVEINTNHASFDLAPFAAKTLSGEYLGFDSDLATKTTDDVTEGLNLYYTTARHDSDTLVQVDAAYVQARQTHYLDSALAQQLIDATYIQANQSNIDSALVQQLIDATYINDRIEIVNDTTPQLGGNLDVNGKNIISTSGNINISAASNVILGGGGGFGNHTVYMYDTYSFPNYQPTPGQFLTAGSTVHGYLEWDSVPYLDSSAIQQLIDASYIQANQSNIDSNLVIQLIDSGYVQLRQDYAYSSLTGAPTALSQFTNDTNYLDSTTAISLVDSTYVRLRQDYAYSSLTGVPTSLSEFTNDNNYLDSVTVQSVIDQTYIQSNQITYNTSNFTDSAFVTGLPVSTFTNDAGYLTSTTVKTVIDSTYIATAIQTDSNITVTITNNITSTIDSAYVLNRVADAPFLDSYYTIELIDSAYVQARTPQIDLSAVDQDIIPAGDAIYDLGDSNNRWKDLWLSGSSLIIGSLKLQVTDGRIKFVDRVTGETVSVTASNVPTNLIDSSIAASIATGLIPTFGNDYVDSATVLDIINSAGLDSDLVIRLVDSAYIQLRDRFQDSSLVTSTVDSAYVQIRVPESYLSTIIDSAYINNRIEIVNDTTPQLGGNLDLNSNNITGSGNINITGNLTASGLAYPTSDGVNGQVITTDGSGNLSFTTITGGGTSSFGNTFTLSLKRTLDNPNSYGTSQGDNFGYSVAISDEYTIISAPFEDSSTGNTTGYAYFYSTETGNLLHSIKNPDIGGGGPQDNFGDAVALSGEYAIIGAPYEEGPSAQSGKAYIYNILSGNLVHTLDNPNAYGTDGNDYFGRAVDISSTHAIVGTYNEDDSSNTDVGIAYIFDISTGNLVHTLDNPNAYGTTQDDRFGNAVAIDGNYAAVSAYYEDDSNGSQSGKVYIFNVSTGNLVHTLSNPNPYGTGSLDYFGIDIAMSGNNLIVGHSEQDSGGYGSGRAHIYNVTTGNLIRSFTNPNPYGTSSYDKFGWAVNISSTHAIVGAFEEDDSGVSNKGIAYIYDLSDGSLVSTLINPNPYGTTANDYFGDAVAISDNYAIVGTSREDDSGGTSSGKAYVYQLYPPFLTSSDIPSIVDSAYIQARQAPGTDSAAVIDLITNTVDSAYINARVSTVDSAQVTSIIDSAYIQARQLDSAATATNAYRFGNQDPAYYLDYNNFTSTPTIPTIDKATIDALNVDADTLDGQDGTYYLNYNNLINTPNVLDSQEVKGIFTSEVEAQALVGGKFIEFIYDTNAIEYNVTVTSKTSAHRYFGTGSSNGYIIRDQEAPFLQFVPGNTYKFIQSHPSNVGHPIHFYYEADKTTEYTTGVTQVGTPGTSGAYTEIVISDTTPSVLHYQCQVHGYMGNAVFTQTRNLTGFDTDDLTEGSTNLYFTEQRVRNVIDSAYVIARQIQGLDSALADGFLMTQAEVLSLIDSAYVQLRQSTSTALDSALVTQLIDSAYIQARQTTGGGGTVDSATTIALIQATVDSAYVAAREAIAGGGASVAFKNIVVNGQNTIVAGSATDTLIFEAGNNITLQTDALTNTVTINSTASGGAGGGVASGLTLTKYLYIADSGQTAFFDSDDNGNVLIYNAADTQLNVYLNGVLLVDSDDFTLTDSNTVTLIAPAQLQDVIQIIKYTPPDPNAGGGTGTVDSAQTIALIDERFGELGTLQVNKYFYDADSGQTVFNGADKFGNTLSITPANIEVYLNGVLQVATTDYTATTTSVTLTEAADSGYSLAIIETIGLVGQRLEPNTVSTTYEFTADSGQTVFTGIDGNGRTLDMSNGVVDIHLNGILLSENNDYTRTDTTLTLLDSADSGDFIAINVLTNVYLASTTTKQFRFTNKTTNILSGNGLTFTGSIQVFKNNNILIENTDYTTSGGTTITLTDTPVSSDVFVVHTFNPVDITGKTYDFIADSGQTVFEGLDRYNSELVYNTNGVIVYLNGIALVDSADYTRTTVRKLTFTQPLAANDEVKIQTFAPADLSGIATPFEITKYEFTADSGQTSFSGTDINGETLAYVSGKIDVYLNGLLLRNQDYTATSGTSLTLASGADSGDELTITKFVGNNIGVTEEDVLTLIQANVDDTHLWSEATTSQNVAINSRTIVDCSGSAVNITLPSNPTLGDEVRIIDGTGNASTNNITILRNGNNIQGAADNLVIDIDRAAIGLVFYNATQGWILIEN